jgi:hypothetical protein
MATFFITDLACSEQVAATSNIGGENINKSLLALRNWKLGAESKNGKRLKLVLKWRESQERHADQGRTRRRPINHRQSFMHWEINCHKHEIACYPVEAHGD